MNPPEEPGEGELKATRKSPFAPTVRLCPRCLKPLKQATTLGGWLVPQDYYCPSCGYAGMVYFEEDVDLRSGRTGG